MKRKFNVCMFFIGLFAIIIFPNCSNSRLYDFSLKNTLSIFMLSNENRYYFCLPVQYMGNYQIQSFEYVTGSVVIGDYNIPLKREGIKISVYLNENASVELGNSTGEFSLIYSEENGNVLVSKMNEPLSIKNNPNYMENHYYIFIEKYLNSDDEKNIINEYEKGNVYSRMTIEYDLIIDNEKQAGSGLIDDFELYDGLAIDPAWFPANLDFFKSKYLQN